MEDEKQFIKTVLKQRHVNIPASYLILRRNNQILLSKRFQTGYEDGKYSMIAGHVDPGESFSQTIIREAKEEAGIILYPDDIKVIHIMHRNAFDAERIDVFFGATKWEGEIENLEPHKCRELAWFSIDDLPDNIISYVKKALSYIDKDVFYSEYGWGF